MYTAVPVCTIPLCVAVATSRMIAGHNSSFALQSQAGSCMPRLDSIFSQALHGKLEHGNTAMLKYAM